MTPKIHMPVLRQLPRDPDRPLWRRLLQIREPVIYELVEDYTISVRVWGYWGQLWLPRGFRSDLASTPRLSWLFGFRPDGAMMIPGLFHDWYYRHGSIELLTGSDSTATFGFATRRGGDRLFLQLARQVTGLRLPPRAAWAALRLCGWWSWRANEKYRLAFKETGQFQLHGDYSDGDCRTDADDD